jgi:hypothetical protein
MSFKYIKSRKRFEKSNLTLDPETYEGRSYRWYLISAKIGGKVFVNKYSYSPTTVKHSGDIFRMLRGLGVEEIYQVSAPRGLRNRFITVSFYNNEISALESKIASKGSRAAKNAERRKEIEYLRKELEIYLRSFDSEDFDRELNSLLAGT